MVLGLASLVLGLASLVLACGGRGIDGRPGEESRDTVKRTIEQVQEAYTPEWMALEGVVGTGIGLCDDEPCIKVFIARRAPELEEAIPDEVEGHRVVLEVTGEFRALDTTGG